MGGPGVLFEAIHAKYHRPTGTACYFRANMVRLHGAYLSSGSVFSAHVTLPRPECSSRYACVWGVHPWSVIENAPAYVGVRLNKMQHSTAEPPMA